jgi:acetate kinase
MVGERLRWLGVELDAAADKDATGRISAPGSRVEVHVIPADEEAMIARHTHDIIA